MSENFNAKGEIELELKGLIGDIDALTDKIGELNEKFGHSTDVFDKLERQVNSAGKTARTAAGDIDKTADSTEKLKGASEQAADMALPRLRYALYDVATTAGMVSASVTAAGAAVLTMSGSYERAFTDVERTTLASAEVTARLREDLMQLTREIPESWGNITEIASVGAQLDIAEESLAQFTETTTKFSTVTGVAAETSAMAFGSIGQLLGVAAHEYENMGSAIAYVGVTSVATDEEIIKMSQRLAASAANAGMTAQEVIALSGALASLRVAPERAQGVMEVYFKNLNNAIADGGERLEAFARYSGMATESVAEMVATDPAGFFRSLAQGLGSLDPVSTTLALDELGLSGIRAGEVFTRVSNNLEVFDQAMANSNQAWADGSHLAHAYGLVVDDLASKWQIFLNAMGEAGASIGDVFADVAKPVLDFITRLVHSFTELIDTPIGYWTVMVAGGIGAVAAALAAAIGTGALALASFAAMGTALKELNFQSGVSAFSLRGLSGAFAQVAGSAGMSSVAIQRWTTAASIASTVALGAGVFALGAAMLDFRDSTEKASDALEEFVGNSGGMMSALQADTEAANAALASGATDVSDKYLALTPTVQESSTALDENRQAIENTAQILGMAAPSYANVNAALQENTTYLGENTMAWFRNQLMQSEAFQSLFQNDDFVDAWMAIGYDFDAAVRASAEGGRDALASYYIELAYQAFDSGQVTLAQIRAISSALADEILYMKSLAEGVKMSAQQLAKFEANRSSLRSGGGGLSLGNVGDFEQLMRLQTGAGNQARVFASQLQDANAALREGGGLANDYANGLNNAGNAAGNAAKKVYTLKDYANDLSQVWDRAFEIRFSGQSTFDQITSAWSKIRKEIDDAADAIAKYQAEIAELNADKSTMEYWLMVAENYGDVLRAEELRAKLAAQDVKLAEASKKLAAEQDKTNKTLVGNSDAAIKNRADILSLVSSYQDHIGALAASGMSQDQLAVKTEQLRQQFIEQATQLGYSRAEIELYAKAFDDVTTAINRIPRNITVTANADPAIQAFNELMTAANNASGAVSGLRGNLGAGMPAPYVDTSSLVHAGRQAEAARLRMFFSQNAFNPNAAPPPYTRAGAMAALNNLIAMGYRKGGRTGFGPDDGVSGVVHNNEFVFSAPAARNIGYDTLAFLHSAAKGGTASSSRASVASTMVVELSPYDRQLLVDVKNAAGLSISGDALTRTAV